MTTTATLAEWEGVRRLVPLWVGLAKKIDGFVDETGCDWDPTLPMTVDVPIEVLPHVVEALETIRTTT